MNELKDQIRNLLVENGCRLDNNLAVSRTVDLLAIFTTRKELEARIDELERLYLVYGSPEQPATLDNVFIFGEKGKTATLPVKDRLNQLSTELKTNKEKEQ